MSHKEAVFLKFAKLVNKLYSHQHLNFAEAETAEIQLSIFCSSVYILQNENFFISVSNPLQLMHFLVPLGMIFRCIINFKWFANLYLYRLMDKVKLNLV